MTSAVTGKFSRWPGVAVLVLATLGASLRGAVQSSANEWGHPIYREFPPGQNKLGPVCSAVVQDAQGIIYVAANYVLQYYDGSAWPQIMLPGKAAGIRKFAVSASGVIYAGGAGVMGWIDASGEDKVFVSLASEWPTPDPDFEDVYDVAAVGETVYFSTENHILIWRDGRMMVVPFPTPRHSHGARLHRVDEGVFVTARGHPLSRLTGDKVEAVGDDPVLRNNEIIELREVVPGRMELLTAERGFFQINFGLVTRLEVDANRWLEGRRIITAQRLADESLVVAFSAPTGDGGMRFDADGNYQGPIDNSLGLYVKTLRSLFPDREGGLWLGTETGMFRLEWPSAATLFDGNNGLGQGTVVATGRHDGVFFAATTEGVYGLSPSDEAGNVARFERLFNNPTYALASHPGGLLALGYDDVHAFESGQFRPIAQLPPGGGRLIPSLYDSARVWITTTQGLSSIRHTPEGWIDEGVMAGTEESVVAMEEEADGSLQITTAAGLRWRLKFAEGATRTAPVTRESGVSGLSSGEVECISEDGGRWIARDGAIDYVPAKGGQTRRLPHLIVAAIGGITSMREENPPGGSVLWISGEKGLMRLEVERAFPPSVPLDLQLLSHSVKSGDRLAPNPPPVRFEFLAQRHQFANVVEYQTRLTGFESSWTPWSTERARIFSNLSAGNYRFEVRARDADGVSADPESFRFAVRPEWWATWWAILGYVAGGIGVLSGVVQLRTRALRRYSDQLEAIVAQRTHELQEHSDELNQQNLELVRLNQLELDEKIAAKLAEEKARLEVLRYQLNPHFLFNTLASISASLPTGDSTARGMLERLGDFCRLTLYRGDDREWTTLAHEIQLLRTYLEIEQSRWGDLLDVEITVQPDVGEIRLPYFLLLPLLENALKYGRQTSLNRVGIRVTARRDSDGAAILEVANTGKWTNPQRVKATPSLGIGLENLRERLTRYYPDAHRLEIVSAEGWVVVTLKIMGSTHLN